jgi:hypothetical protein
MKLIIVELTEKQKFAFDSMTDAHTRREAALSEAQSANEILFKEYSESNLDDLDGWERVDQEDKLWRAERDASRAWKRYQTANTRYLYELAECRALGIIE